MHYMLQGQGADLDNILCLMIEIKHKSNNNMKHQTSNNKVNYIWKWGPWGRTAKYLIYVTTASATAESMLRMW